jgi:hypothetical protein
LCPIANRIARLLDVTLAERKGFELPVIASNQKGR